MLLHILAGLTRSLLQGARLCTHRRWTEGETALQRRWILPGLGCWPRGADAENWGQCLPAFLLQGPPCARTYLDGQPPPAEPPNTRRPLLLRAYLVYTFGVFQPSVVHLLHIVGASPAEKGLGSHRGAIAPDLPQRPGCCWSVWAQCLRSL